MGGNALPSVPTRRLAASEYHRLAAQVTAALTATFGARAQAIPAYRSKADFGDLDVVVEQEKVLVAGDGYAALRAFAQREGHARAFNINGGVMSYDHRFSPDDPEGFQVDLLVTPAAEMDAALAYFSYNDLGNLIGRTAHKMGFSYGHRGLVFPVREGDHLFTTLQVTADTDQALRFLGYDPARFRQGFEGLSDIFDYVTGSRYFNGDLFLLENRNHTSRTRDRKRKTYAAFLDHLQANPQLPNYVYPESKSAWLAPAFAAFPDFERAHRQALADLSAARAVRARFNGEKVGAWTGMSGPTLGAVMGKVKASFPTTAAFAHYLEHHDDDALEALVREQASTLSGPVGPGRKKTPR